MSAPPSRIHCFRCGRAPEEISEYDEGVFWERGEYRSPTAYVLAQEGTYNPETRTFACDECYMAIGQPTSLSGWRAPATLAEFYADLDGDAS